MHNHVSVYTIGLVTKGTLVLTRGKRDLRLKPHDVFVVAPYEPHSLCPLDAVEMVSLCIPKDFFAPCRKDLLESSIKSLFMCDVLSPREVSALLRATEKLAPRKTAKEVEEEAFVSRIRGFLERAPDSRITVRQLAESEAVCEDHMIREFKRKVGLTPRQFQIQNRIRMAQLLLEKGLPASEAALSAGFYDQSHLDKYFRHFLGIPPGKYVMAYREHVSR